jgi:basic membrane protein A and related proteins
MKKILSVFVLLFTVVLLSSCELEVSTPSYKIAMITDAGDIDDKSFNQGTWEGIVKFAKENDLTHKYYKPTEVSDNAYVTAIDLAVSGGAEIIVTPGFLFEPALYTAQEKYPDVKFVLIDGVPHPGDYTTFEVADNTISILFKEQESGFLAGYAAVMEGFRELGFMGGIAVPAVVRFGVGYVAGAYYAADELGLDDFEFNMDYFEYLGTFAPGDDVKSKAASWYGSGVEIIHVAAGGAGNSVMAAAEEAVDGKVIGVDVDQANQSDTVISSAMKALGVVVQQALQNYLDDTWVGGVTQNLGATQDAVGLPLGDSFKFENFTLAQYNSILTILKAGELGIPTTEEELTDYIEALRPVVNLHPVKDALDAAADAEVTVHAKVVGIANHNTFYISDGTNSIAVYDGPKAFIGTLQIGDVVEVVGTRGNFRGLNQIIPTSVTVVADVVIPDTQDLDGDTADLTADLTPHQGRYFTFTDVVISAVSEDQHGNLTFSFTVGTLSFNVRYDSRLVGSEDAATHLKAFTEGSTVDLRLILGWYDNPQFLYQDSSNITLK